MLILVARGSFERALEARRQNDVWTRGLMGDRHRTQFRFPRHLLAWQWGNLRKLFMVRDEWRRRKLWRLTLIFLPGH